MKIALISFAYRSVLDFHQYLTLGLCFIIHLLFVFNNYNYELIGERWWQEKFNIYWNLVMDGFSFMIWLGSIVCTKDACGVDMADSQRTCVVLKPNVITTNLAISSSPTA